MNFFKKKAKEDNRDADVIEAESFCWENGLTLYDSKFQDTILLCMIYKQLKKANKEGDN